jgi:hypothetical protein
MQKNTISDTLQDLVVKSEYSGLTGKTRFRTTMFGKLVLQVEYSYTDYDQHAGSTTRNNWRDARVEDLTLLEPK